jgi:hypothetical protein
MKHFLHYKKKWVTYETEFLILLKLKLYRLCGLVVQIQRPGFDSRRYQIF